MESRTLTNKSSFASFPPNSTLFLLFCAPGDFFYAGRAKAGGERGR